MTFAPPKRKLTADEYQQMGATGIIGEDERVELLNGAIYEMAPTGDHDNGGVVGLNYRFNRRAGDHVIVSAQGAIRLTDYSELEPDIALLRFRADFYREGTPRPADILLIVEVTTSSLAFDRGLKLSRYAAAGITESWIADLVDEVVQVYRETSGDQYVRQYLHRRGETLSPRTVPNLTLTVEEILG